MKMKKSNDYFSINKLAKYSRTTRATLIHYENVDILYPAFVDGNKCRYYSYEQIGLINLVRTLQLFGMSLKEIAEITQNRTPKEILSLLRNQLMTVNKIISEQLETQKLILTLQGSIEEAMDINENEITVCREKKKAVFMGPRNNYPKEKENENSGRKDYDALLKFYDYCENYAPYINLNYTPWGYFSKERIEKGEWVYPDNYYLYTPDGNSEKPEGLYVTGYTRGNYGYPHTDKLYKRMMKYIDENNLVIAGGSYEEYPLNELSIKDPANYLIRISILVKEKR